MRSDLHLSTMVKVPLLSHVHIGICIVYAHTAPVSDISPNQIF